MISPGIVVAGQHVGIGHARHRQVREALAAAVAGGRDAHQARVERVLQVAAQDAVLDQGRALRRVPSSSMFSDPRRPSQRAIVDDGDAGRRHALADAAGVHRGALAIEVALEAMADGFVQQHARPARPEHHRHHAGRRIHGIEVDERLAQRFPGDRLRLALCEQFLVRVATATAGIAGFAPALRVLDDHLHVEAHQRPHVGGDDAIAARDQDRVHAAGQADDHLLGARIGVTHEAVDLAQHRHLLFRRQAVDRIDRRVQVAAGHRDALPAGPGWRRRD